MPKQDRESSWLARFKWTIQLSSFQVELESTKFREDYLFKFSPSKTPALDMMTLELDLQFVLYN